MRDTHFTLQERRMISWLRICAVFYLMLASLIAFLPNIFVNYINNLGLAFFDFISFDRQGNPLGHWWTMGVALMSVLVYCSFKAQSDWILYHLFTPILIIAGVVLTICFAVMAFIESIQFYFIVGGGLFFFMTAITWFYYVKAIHSRTF